MIKNKLLPFLLGFLLGSGYFWFLISFLSALLGFLVGRYLR